MNRTSIIDEPLNKHEWLIQTMATNNPDRLCTLAKIVITGRDDLLHWLQTKKLITKHDFRANNCYMLRLAAGNNQLCVLNWLDKQNVATLEDCRADLCGALRWAAAKDCINVLEWLRKKRAATAADCRADENYALRKAAEGKYVRVLEWLRKQGAAAVEDCRTLGCKALIFAVANNHMAVVHWLENQGAATLADCRTNYDEALCLAFGNFLDQHPAYNEKDLYCAENLKWLARRLTAAEFRAAGMYCLWIYVRRESMFALILAGRRRKIWLPPELWQLIDDTYPEGIIPPEYW